MTGTPQLPEHLHALRDSVVALYGQQRVVPADLQQLQEWLEVDGWDALIADFTDEMALNIRRLADRHFNDAGLRWDLGLPKSSRVTDAQRLAYARNQISEATTGDDGSIFPSVHAYPLTASDGRSAVLCCTVEIHGQAGPVACWLGLYADRKAFLDALDGHGYWLGNRIASKTDADLLAYWQHPPTR